jgi:hypothetical protein
MSESNLADDVRKIKLQLAKLEARVVRLESEPSLPSGRPPLEKKPSINEFIIEKEVSTDTDKTLVIAYYLEKFEGLSEFNTDDLSQGFKRAKEPPPGNLNETVNKNVRKGYLMESGQKEGKKAWALTNSGDEFVDTGLGRGQIK